MPSRKKFLARAGRDRASHARDARAGPRCGRRRLRLFDRWLLLKDDTCSLCSAPSPPTISQRPGLGLIAPPSSAKTEILNSTLKSAARGAGRNCNTRGVALRHAQEAARRRRQIWAASANRRLRHHHRQRLRLGTLDASRDQGRDVGVLREVYDGSWIRHIDSDGGRTLHWYGKVGLVSPALG